MVEAPSRSEYLFSYGTLQLEVVQLSTFGRTLHGVADALVGFEQAEVKIADPSVVKTSGKAYHPIVRYTGRKSDKVAGMVFRITPSELLNADKYEVAAYSRVAVTLLSGQSAWV